jgi:signal peptidase
MTKSGFMSVSNMSACDLIGEVVRKTGRVRLRVSGTSMVPAMRPGDLITVECAGPDEIKPGEIVVFARAERLVVHRVKAIVASPAAPKNGDSREILFATRGDRARRNDPMVSSSELLGRVTHVERGDKSALVKTKLSAREQLVSRLLRNSNRATSLYLRVSAL